MLADRERKIYLILRNYHTMHWKMPGWKMLVTKTGRSVRELRETLNLLEQSGWIEWDGRRPESVRLAGPEGRKQKNTGFGTRNAFK